MPLNCKSIFGNKVDKKTIGNQNDRNEKLSEVVTQLVRAKTINTVLTIDILVLTVFGQKDLCRVERHRFGPHPTR